MDQPIMQSRQDEWAYQWQRLEDHEAWLFRDWIWPNRLEDFAGKAVLDCGCGPGHHVRLVAAHARKVIGIDLNAASIAQEKLRDLSNVEVIESDIAVWDRGEQFDVVYSVGVVHHTSDPDKTIAHLKKLVKPGGRLIVWVYSREGNGMNRLLLEPAKRLLIRFLPRFCVMGLSHLLAVSLYAVVYTIYLLPLNGLPFYEYFTNFRKMNYRRNQANVFDKLNAPTTHFISKEQAEGWLEGLEDRQLSPYVGVSWRVSARKPLSS